MTNKCTLTLKHNDTVVTLDVADINASHATAPDKCPYCGTVPFLVAGHGSRPSADDRAWEADGGCIKCRAHVGTIRQEVSTIFGVREDARVTSMGIRVF